MYVAFIISRGGVFHAGVFHGGNMWDTLAAARRQMRQTNEQTNSQTDRQTNRCTLPLRKAPLRQRLNNKQICSKREKCLIKIHLKNGASQHGFYVPGVIFCDIYN